MGYETINARIRVVADFKDGCITPYFFDWNRRRYKVDKVNLMHERKEGKVTNYLFSVSTSFGEFLIKYNRGTNNWWLEQVHLE